MERQADCVFCKIVAGEIPSRNVFEDEASIAFLDIAPLAPGHIVLVPKVHYATMGEMPADQAAALARPLPRLTSAVISATGSAGCNVLQNNGSVAGQVVGHVHIHVIPRVEGDRLGYRWPAGEYASGQADAVERALAESMASLG